MMTTTSPNLPRATLRLLRPYLALVTGAALLGVLNGIGVTALLATINAAMTGAASLDATLALRFIALCAGVVLCSLFSNFITAYVGQHVLAQLRKDLAARILVAPIEQLERYGSHRLIPVLVHDTGSLSNFVLSVAPLVVAATVTVGGIVYLSLLSPVLVLMTLAAVAVGTGAQWLALRLGGRGLASARAAEDDLQKHYEAISDGAKELRIQRPRRHRLLSVGIHGAAGRIRDNHISASKFFIGAETFGGALFFIVIGLTIGAQSLWHGGDKAVLGGFVLVLLYLRGPLAQLTGALPLLGNAQVSLRRIVELSEQFATAESHLLTDPVDDTPATPVHSIELRDIGYTFPPTAPGQQPFHLGPLNLTIGGGQIVFIVGENGTGKTTLIKLLLGLYPPQQGQILLNGKPVTTTRRDDYRQLFSTIFSDYYLFDDLSNATDDCRDSAQQYLERLDLAHKVEIRDGMLSTTALSTGQRKRLALLNAWLENRPVLLFDEWAADQDPAFRRVFYTELLPELKQRGKTLIVISHDDRYFDIADRVLRMRAGQITVENGAAQRES